MTNSATTTDSPASGPAAAPPAASGTGEIESGTGEIESGTRPADPGKRNRRDATRVVNEYLDLRHRKSIDRPSSIAMLHEQKTNLGAELAAAMQEAETYSGPDMMHKLFLAKKKVNVLARIEKVEANLAMADRRDEVEQEFVDVAKAFGERNTIPYRAWRELRVPAGVLKRAGIHPD